MSGSNKSPDDNSRTNAVENEVTTDADTDLSIDASEVGHADAEAGSEEHVAPDLSNDEEPIASEAEAPLSPTRKSTGFVPLILGGAVCVVLGYAGANFVKPEGWPFPGSSTDATNERLATLEVEIEAIRNQNIELSSTMDTALSNFDAKVDELVANLDVAADLEAALAPLRTELTALDERLFVVEAAPVAEAIVSPEATAAYERQLANMQALLDDEIKRLNAAKEISEAVQAQASRFATVARLQEAIAAGLPYADILEGRDMPVPAAVSEHAASGVPSLSALQDEFSSAADMAIVETAKLDDPNQGMVDRFLRTQLGLRSLTPKDGASPDAILSRAEQALRENDLEAALTEVSALPEVGQEIMADWAAHAQSRLDVLKGLDDLIVHQKGE